MMPMDPKEGQHVRVLLRNGHLVEGTVILWGTPVVLKTLDGTSQMIIHHPKDDIMLTKVLLVEQPTVQIREQAIAEKIQEQAAEEGHQIDPVNLNAMTKAQLHVELAEQERRIVADKLKTHYPDTAVPRKKTYGYPGFFQKPRAK